MTGQCSFTGMELALAMLDGSVVSPLLGAPGLKLQGAKPLVRSIPLALAVSSLLMYSLTMLLTA